MPRRTPAESLSGRFVRIDQKKYGKIPGVTDREYYTNSFHVPVYYPIKAYKKIQLEAPYHALTNAGHISYVELDGDTCKNLKAFESVIRYMKEQGIGYGSVNHPVDRDPVCGYTGVIDDIVRDADAKKENRSAWLSLRNSERNIRMYRCTRMKKLWQEGLNMTGEELRNADAAANNAVVGEGVKFERIRRITGYLVGTTDRFNDAKRAEEHDRVKHGLN
ncbi:MAG: anaerobic ribonucleoside-triphosphate reductase [Coprococcus sp.]